MEKITVHDKKFKLFIPHNELISAIEALAERIKQDYSAEDCPVFLGVLNGSFMFMSELVKCLEFSCELVFVKVASYSGLSSTGTVQDIMGLTKSLKDRDVIVVEDIVETGASIEHVKNILTKEGVKSFQVATLFMKPNIYKKQTPIKYVAREIGDEFIVGFGLDYNHLGRNYKDVYVIDND
ncbi:MAG: phosphoribosyltransferase family protein [Rikenellaceae bacterium]